MSRSFRHDIQGLRAVAVGFVLFFHLFPHVLPGGFVGVDVFFVISGYVITKSLVKDIQNNGSSVVPVLVRFYQKRIRRILPALSVILVVTLVAGWLVLVPSDYFIVAESALYSIFGVGNFYFLWNTGYFDQASMKQPLLHMWSLGVEEQFYIVWPVLLALALKLPIQRAVFRIVIMTAIIAIGFGYNINTVALDPKSAFYLPTSRAWELGVGALLAFVPAISRRSVSEGMSIIGLVLIGSASLALNAVETSTGWPMLQVVVGTGLLVWPRADNLIARLLGALPLRAIGAISFSLYLWHWPLISFAAILDIDTMMARVAIVPLSVFLATVTYLVVERPALKKRWFRIAIPTALLSAGGTAVIAGAIVSSGGAPTRFPAEIQPVLALSDYVPAKKTRHPACWLDENQEFSDYGDECGEGQFLVWGDSHAAMLYPGLRKSLGETAEYTRNGCMPLVDKVYRACADGNEAILRKIAELKPRTVILFAAWLNYPVKWEDGWPYGSELRRTLRELKALGVHNVMVLGPAPMWEPTLPSAVYSFWIKHGFLPDRLYPADQPYEIADEAIMRVATSEGAEFVSIYNLLCDPRGCRTHTANAASELISWDYGHFTWQGAEYVVELLFGARNWLEKSDLEGRSSEIGPGDGRAGRNTRSTSR